MSDDELTKKIIGAEIEVHRTLGPGFLERIYRESMILEFCRRGIKVESEKPVIVHDKGTFVGQQRLDLLVDATVVVELKAIETLHGMHYAQLRSYLHATNLQTGLLINFNGPKVDYRRVDMTPKEARHSSPTSPLHPHIP